MTEQECLESADAEQMLRCSSFSCCLRVFGHPRKSWLFIVACYRRWWLRSNLYLPGSDQRDELINAIDALESCAEGEQPADWNLVTAAFQALSIKVGAKADLGTAVLGFQGLLPYHWTPIARGVVKQASQTNWANSSLEVAELMRCILGDFIRPIVIPFPNWLSKDVFGIAKTIYTEDCFHDLPILGDALEDAGCDSELVLGHCRNGGEHGRGCWVVDRILGKH